MRDIESGVSKHYASYDVLARIRAGLVEMGHDPDRISPEVLKAVDEFHIGGAEATATLLEKLDIRPATEVLDIGSGIGGPARMIAARYGCRVTGVDLTPHFVETARALSTMCGMEERVRFEVGSAVALPLPDASFDRTSFPLIERWVGERSEPARSEATRSDGQVNPSGRIPR